MNRRMSRRAILVLAGVLLLQSIVVAAVFTPQPHSGGDNAGYLSLAHSLLDRGTYQEIWDPAEPPHTKYPPVFPALLAAMMLLGAKTWGAFKLIPAFSTVLAVAFTFLWVRERRGIPLAVAVALLLGFSESVVYYSQWILSDPTFLALSVAALWALDRQAGWPRNGEEGERRWLPLAAGMALVVLAYLTRSAGLPLVVATFLWLGMKKRWKAVALFGLAFGVPAALWFLRGKVLGGSEYVSEFWLMDPYQPHLGTVGIGGLFQRAVDNLVAYCTVIIPGGIVGDGWGFLPPLGIGLALTTVVGWVRAVRDRVGPAELFLPLYLGLILLWPTPWSGDRFALPLLPLLFFYSGAALLWLFSSLPAKASRPTLVVLSLAVVLLAGTEWTRMASQASACRKTTREGAPSGCLFPAQGEYLALAEWSGRNLPDGAVVTTRKPRTFYVMSGVKARSIPLVADRTEFLRRLQVGDSRYVTLDLLDRVSGSYVYPVVLEHLDFFCGLVEVGGEAGARTQLLGFLGTTPRVEETQGESTVLPRCSPGMLVDAPVDGGPAGNWEIPLVAWKKKGRGL
jgi:hypothetical protein